MKTHFAKIFEFENHQVLVTKDDSDDGFEVVQATDLGTMCPLMKVGFKTEKMRDKYFNEYDEKIAKHFLDEMIKLTDELEIE